jgi:hypothetical protein
MPSFTDQRERLRRTVQNALDGAIYESSRREEDGRMLVIEAKRPDGRRVGIRFRGVRESEASEAPLPGSSLRLRGVDSAAPLSVIGFFFPFLRPGSGGVARVRIEIGTARLEIVCEDAEWWEGTGAPGDSGGSTP